MAIDLDTTDVEVYGRPKRGVAYNHQGQRVGRPHVATWADTATVLAADLLAGNEDPRRDAPALLGRALAALPTAARGGKGAAACRCRVLRRAAGPRRPVHRDRVRDRGAADRPFFDTSLDGIGEADWTDAIAIPSAQVAEAAYCSNWWPASTGLLIRRVRLDVAAGRVSADPRARRRRTLHPTSAAPPTSAPCHWMKLTELAATDQVYGYSFVVILWNAPAAQSTEACSDGI